ncbi:hypothetical protein JN531_015560 [Flagellatimonas centrodinii]|uniref:tetratricopeptide repeat protein n=1 Tax=Flagellatimonas centrodinii TaxID=2806210 RepID=UPI001FEFECB1|nr:hypothetical protein [Flagellatimonas centrodinii]ULQ46503.1 hypothetical protein JN531_015560 [Flagellatimonas centrodinii]
MNPPPVLNVEPIYALLRKAQEAIAIGDEDSAERFCDDAWNAIPEPKYGWDSSYICTSHEVALLRSLRRFDKAISLTQGYLDSGFHLEYEDGPFFWLGTLHFEKDDLDKAYEFFERANKMSRGHCFREEDPKYKLFFKGYAAK